MNEPGISKTRIVLALLEQIANDGDAGVDRTVADYQRLFPGHEETIAQELAGLPGTRRRSPRSSPGCVSKPGRVTRTTSISNRSAPTRRSN